MLGMTIMELDATMPLDEYHKWRAFLSHEQAMRKLHG
jgi:hypothetical protein